MNNPLSPFQLAEQYTLIGNQHANEGNISSAIEYFEKAIQAYPQYEIAYLNLGNAYLNTGQTNQAITYYKQALRHRPSYPMAETNLGVAYSRRGDFTKALTHFQNVMEISPDYADVYLHLGNIFLAQGNFDDAITCYKMTIEKDPDAAGAYNNLGTAYARIRKYTDSIAAFKQAIKHGDTSSDAHTNLGTAYVKTKKPGLAITALKKAVAKNPNNSTSLATLYKTLRDTAAWDALPPIEKQLDNLTLRELDGGHRPGQDPFISVIKDQNPALNLRIATAWSRYINNMITDKIDFNFKKRTKSDKIRIGYVSAHFHDHPTSHLIATMLRLHNRDQFQVHAYSFGSKDSSHYYPRIIENVDYFQEVWTRNFSEIATQIYQDEIDILVDLDGHTDDNKLEVFALRPAPVQVTYLAFPGTTGLPQMDYMLSDHIVAPKIHQPHFSEQLIHIPPTYQINDDSFKGNLKPTTRAAHNLPEDAFVFCCFNGSYKIEPATFHLWMLLLEKVENSVLWLLKTNSLAEANLKKEAQKHGIKPQRLMFARRLPREKHLSRLKLADLALDTWTCNGHTTTSDTLWAGVPLVTLIGKHFASRVAASVLTAAGVPELITRTKGSYFELALHLATTPDSLTMVRQKLLQNQDNTPLFNTLLQTQMIEKAYQAIWDRYKQGKKPAPITIK